MIENQTAREAEEIVREMGGNYGSKLALSKRTRPEAYSREKQVKVVFGL